MSDVQTQEPAAKSRGWLIWLPLGLFILLIVIAAFSLANPTDRVITSKLVGQSLPEFDLPPAIQGSSGLKQTDFADGKPKLLNVFASWCVPCIVEAPQLDQLAKSGVVIHGIAIRDRPDDVQAFLARNGNPYNRIGADDISAVQLSLGSSGVPETFVIDGKGTIVHQHIGEIRPEAVPLILEKLKEAGR
ncbi:MAG: DsbE family thiol:disulfide interchange protein [Pseudomonadota bacterium]